MHAERQRQIKYGFGGFTLDVSRGMVRKADGEVKLRPKVYDALLYLLQNRGRLISKEELIHELWPDSFVTEDSLVQCMVELRRALSDGAQEIVRTVPRKGYEFTAAVTTHEDDDGKVNGVASIRAEDDRLVVARRLPGRYFPLPRTPLMGRERELLTVSQLLLSPDSRLVTLTGTGGCGKTRLGLQVASELVHRFEQRVYFVGLASITDPAMVPMAIAESLGIPQTGGRPLLDLLKDYLCGAEPSPVLLLLDNFEHLLPASPLVVELLDSCAALKVLVTSRAALHLYGEREFPVLPLPLPDPRHVHSLDVLLSNPAVALFAQRAAAVKPDFEITAENGTTVAAICSKVDGLPLAIELAAARVKMLPPGALLTRLESRLRVLTAGPRDLPERQQTLRRTIDWSYELLNGSEQKLLRRLGVFLGGCTLEAAEAVCNTRNDLGAEIFNVMSSLMDQSLVQQTEQGDDEPRFGMLETIREYCLERLGESGEEQATRRSHAAYCLVLAEEGNPDLGESERAGWLARCDIEHDNFRAALDSLIESSNVEWSFRMCIALFRFWEMREHLAEGRARLESLLRMDASGPERDRAKVFVYLSTFATVQRDFPAATEFLEKSLSIYRSLGDQWGMAVSMNALAIVAGDRQDYAAAQNHFDESLARWRALGDRVAMARCLHNFANVARGRGDYSRARTLLVEAGRIFEDLKDHSGAAWSLNQLGDIAREEGDVGDARRLYQRALSAFREANDRWGIARSLTDLAQIACDERDHMTAHAAYREALALFVRLGHKRGIARALEGFACSALAQRDPARALAITAAAAHLRQWIGAPLMPAEQSKLREKLEPAWTSLDEADSKAAYARGWAMSLETAIQYALEQSSSATPN
jgi:predicted ATPase/DNA-binding winged helix-turn-helix (wHTH) protein